MGARWSELWIKASPEKAERAAEELGEEFVPGTWVSRGNEDFEGEKACGDGVLGLGAREESDQYGEAVYVAMYDGPAGELCGTFLYERAVDGVVVRALAFAPDADMNLRWVRVEGTPEPWEAELVAQHLEKSIAWEEDMRRWNDPPLPPLTEAERADLARRWSAIRVGETGPRISEYVLSNHASAITRP